MHQSIRTRELNSVKLRGEPIGPKWGAFCVVQGNMCASLYSLNFVLPWQRLITVTTRQSAHALLACGVDLAFTALRQSRLPSTRFIPCIDFVLLSAFNLDSSLSKAFQNGFCTFMSPYVPDVSNLQHRLSAQMVLGIKFGYGCPVF